MSTQTKGVLLGIEVLILKFAHAHAEKCSQAGYVFHAQIDPTVLGAAARASGLAGETHALDNQPATLQNSSHKNQRNRRQTEAAVSAAAELSRLRLIEI